MFNALWFNAQEFDGTGQLYKSVTLAATVTAGATPPAAPVLYVRLGLAAHPTCGATSNVSLVGLKTLFATALVNVQALPTNYMRPLRAFSAHVYTNVTGVLGTSISKTLAAVAQVRVTGIMYPYVTLAAHGTSVVSFASLNLRKTQMLRANVTSLVSVVAPAWPVKRQMYASPKVTVKAISNPDVKVGGTVRWALFGTTVSTNVTATCTPDPKRNFASHVYTLTSGILTTMNKIVRFDSPTGNRVTATAVAQFLGALAYMFPVKAQVSATIFSAKLYNIRLVYASAQVVTFFHLAPVLSCLYYNYANANVRVDASFVGGMKIRKGLAVASSTNVTAMLTTPKTADKEFAYASTSVGASATMKLDTKLQDRTTPIRAAVTANATADMTVKPTIKLAAAVSTNVSATTNGYFTGRRLFVNATILTVAQASLTRRQNLAAHPQAGARAVVALFDNFFELEPDFRTYLVDQEDSTVVIDAEDDTFYITDDSLAMKTFGKQPGDSLAYDIDFTVWFAGTSDFIVSQTTAVLHATGAGAATSDITVVAVSVVNDANGIGRIVKAQFAGGHDGCTYEIRTTISTQSGQTKEANYLLTIKDE